ncbi:MAG: hypothetical protein JWP48_6480 [Actinoallomurus sp.]|jgi:2-methylaconitate cis-trans-isomerase PrpF|nr:hypothetical protein [Actinoallomurus sp.]
MSADSSGVPCMLMRGGTSKGAYFLAADLPADDGVRDDLLLRIMGTPDPRQIDGIGGAHPLTSKVAVELDTGAHPPRVRRSGVVRTARKLFDGIVYPRT